MASDAASLIEFDTAGIDDNITPWPGGVCWRNSSPRLLWGRTNCTAVVKLNFGVRGQWMVSLRTGCAIRGAFCL